MKRKSYFWMQISIHTCMIDSILFPKFFCDPVFVFYESFIRDTLNIGKGSYDYLWSSYSLGKSQNTWEASVTNLELKETLVTKRDKPIFIRNQFPLELLWFLKIYLIFAMLVYCTENPMIIYKTDDNFVLLLSVL